VSCDYPEQGFFLLSGVDARGGAVTSHVFEIKELVDDTDLTYGFTIHVYDPAAKVVIDLPFDNVPEFTRRGWLFSLADADYGHGDLALDLTHDDKMSFVGAWRAQRSGKLWPLAGEIQDPEGGQSRIRFDLPLPPGEAGVVGYTVEELTVKQVAERLGKLNAYKHIAGSLPEALDAGFGRNALEAQQDAQARVSGAPVEQKPRYTPPPLGGRP
jgi:hypothetical protein